MLKRFLGSLLASHALVFLWSVLGFVAFVDLRLYAQVVRRHAVFAASAHLDSSTKQWVSPLNVTGPDDPPLAARI